MLNGIKRGCKRGFDVIYLPIRSNSMNPINPLIEWPYISRCHDGVHSPAVKRSIVRARRLNATKKYESDPTEGHNIRVPVLGALIEFKRIVVRAFMCFQTVWQLWKYFKNLKSGISLKAVTTNSPGDCLLLVNWNRVLPIFQLRTLTWQQATNSLWEASTEQPKTKTVHTLLIYI